MAHPNIDRLNELLKDPKLNLPPHRQRVDVTGYNLKFLRKVFSQKPEAPQEIKTLLSMKDKDLMMKAP